VEGLVAQNILTADELSLIKELFVEQNINLDELPESEK